jgi:hypothetical protein
MKKTPLMTRPPPRERAAVMLLQGFSARTIK